MRTHRVLAPARLSMHRSLSVLALCGVIALSACGGGGPSVRAEPDDSTTTSSSEPEPTTSTTVGGPTTTTTATVDGQVVRYQGLQFVVPTSWPVYDLAANPRTCVRVNRHAVYLGSPGLNQDCPAHATGHTESVQVQPLGSASQIAVARATSSTVLNGMAALFDPDPDTIGALTVVLPDLGLVAFVSYGDDSAQANQLLASFALSPP